MSSMKILITGANGFVGKNLTANLRAQGYTQLFECDVDTSAEELKQYTAQCDFVFHLAGVNRSENPESFIKGNRDFTAVLLNNLEQAQNACPVLTTSSIQAKLDNAYGRSKAAEENLVFAHREKTGAKAFVYRLPNLFGKWCRPNYNSVVATFCNNIARNLPIRVDNPETVLTLAYIDDVIREFNDAMDGIPTWQGKFCGVGLTYNKSLGDIVRLLELFRESRVTLQLQNMADEFTKKLYSTYMTYLPEDEFSYPLAAHVDERGSFTEMIRTKGYGQFSVNISKPGISKGNHWHHTKNEKFLVVQGNALVQFRKIHTQEIIEYNVSGRELRVVDIPPGYSHKLINIGDEDLITLIWASECFDPENPDTFYEEV